MSFGWLGWKFRMRAEAEAMAWRFFGVLEGVGSMLTDGGAGCEEVLESEDVAALVRVNCRLLRGVLCVTGDAGDEGGEDSWVG